MRRLREFIRRFAGRISVCEACGAMVDSDLKVLHADFHRAIDQGRRDDFRDGFIR